MNEQARQQENHDALAGLIARQGPGFGLDAEFYSSTEIYERDLERIFMQCWLYAGHVSLIPQPGDYFLFEIGNESVIIVRSAQGDVNALVNVCRHRGSRVCLKPCGNAKTFVCGYHGWTYGLGGELRSKRAMPDDFDRSAFGLKRIHVEVLCGLIFVSFDPNPSDFQAATGQLGGRLKPYGLDRTKVAERRRYQVHANWKLAVENFMECYHCAPAHREYAQIHSLKAPSSETAELQSAMEERAEALGLSCETLDQSGRNAPYPGLDVFCRRHALYPGYQTGSEDGKPVAPLLGDLKGYDGGATDVAIGSLNFMLIYSDYAVVYGFAPNGCQEAHMEITWLVNETAVEDADYDLERLTWLWHVTSEADKRIINNNQTGVNSRFYEPGPYSEMESYASEFVAWYLLSIA